MEKTNVMRILDQKKINYKSYSYIDTDAGISHFGEHMVLQGSEKYDSIYPVLNNFIKMNY